MKTTIRIPYLILLFVGAVLGTTSVTRIWLGITYPVTIGVDYRDFVLLSVGISLLVGCGIASFALRKATA